MQTSGSVPAPAVSAADLGPVLDHPGPYLTVYLTTEAGIDNAGPRSEQRWKALRAELAEQGAAEEALAAVDPLVPEAHQDGECLAAVVAADGFVHVEHQPDPPTRDVGRWGALPALGPLVEWHQQSVPHVVVLTDRKGADLIAFRREGPETVREVEGDEDPLSKSAPGGWSQRRYQQRAENTWDQNAGEVAAELTRLVERTGARLVVVAGDVRAVQLLRQHLSPEVDALVRVVDGGRSPDGSTDEVADEATRLAATVVAADTKAMLEKFREERGQQDRAADGPEATIAVLNESRVDVLLVPGDVADGGHGDTAWFGPDPTPIAASAGELRDLGVEEPQEAPLTDVLIRAALGTGARIRVVPSAAAPHRGIGAILRW